jgi:DNA phosphorothioation-dependent restriction protein DptG
MKVKLLRRVRKRYSIVRIDQLASNANEWDQKIANITGLPFYRIIDNDRPSSWISKYRYDCKLIEDAKEKLIQIIVNDYKEQFRHKDAVITKVWYKGN